MCISLLLSMYFKNLSYIKQKYNDQKRKWFCTIKKFENNEKKNNFVQ